MSVIRCLLVDGHSVIHAWPRLRALHQDASRRHLAREALIRELRAHHDLGLEHVIVVFDGKGGSTTQEGGPGEMQIFYARSGLTADDVIERLARKYAKQWDVRVATADQLEASAVVAAGATTLSPAHLEEELVKGERFLTERLRKLRKQGSARNLH